MKSLLEFMNRDRLKKYKTKPEYRYFPKSILDLKDIVKKLIEERGNKADLNDIDTSNIRYMGRLFYIYDGLDHFNGDISKWDVSNVEDMSYMFANSKFNGDISDWKPNPKCRMWDMFLNCPLSKNPPKWYKE